MSETLHQALLQALAERVEPSTPLWVAYSGGLDSSVLLHLAAKVCGQDALQAIHVHHGLHPEAENWARHCQHESRKLGLPCHIARVTVSEAGNMEAQARQARYQAFAEHLSPGSVLLMAHHQDDQAETVLFRCLRGEGISGLRGIPGTRHTHNYTLLRPFLTQSRSALMAYAQQHDLHWIEDPANRDLQRSRNYLRHVALPSLAPRFPGLSRRLARLAEDAVLAEQALVEKCSGMLSRMVSGQSLDLSKWRTCPPVWQRTLLYYWCKQRSISMPERTLEAFQAQLQVPSRMTELVLPAATLISWRDRLYPVEAASWAWLSGASFPAHDWHPGLRIDERALGIPGALRARFPGADFQVTCRQGGERWRDPRGGPALKLKNLLAEAGVPPQLRRRLPLLWYRSPEAADWCLLAYWLPGQSSPTVIRDR